MRRFLSFLGLSLVVVAFSTVPAFAGPFPHPTCNINGVNVDIVNGTNFANVAGNTCDIGSLQFSFESTYGGIIGVNAISNENTGSYVYYATWVDSNFYFTPVIQGSNLGFTLTLLAGPQSISPPQNDVALDVVNVYYTLNGWADDVSVSGSKLSASGSPFALASYFATGGPWLAVDADVAGYGYSSYQSPPSPQGGNLGLQWASPFALEADYGGTASYGVPATLEGPSTTITYTTPEPSSLLLFGTFLVSMAGFIRRRGQEGR